MEYLNLEHNQRELQNAVWSIPPEAADAVAVMLMQIAQELRIISRRHAAQETREKVARRENFRTSQIPVRVQKYLNDGFALDRAQRLTCRDFDTVPDIVAYHWKRHQRALKTALRRENKTKARQMMKAGHRNAEIAAALGVSIPTVVRYLRDAR